MKVAFVVQGEGRGHMTQALALRHMLQSAGHEVVAALVGTSSRRRVPDFFVEKIGAPVTGFASPNFSADSNERTIQPWKTVWTNALKTGIFLDSMRRVEEVIAETKPDVVVNFYEPLWGLSNVFKGVRVPTVAVAHQLLESHPAFPFPSGRRVEKALLHFLTNVNTARASVRLGLSFSPLDPMRKGDLVVVPPLLRPNLKTLPRDVTEDFLLVYVMQSGYGDDIRDWHERHPEVELHCFWDREGAAEVERVDETLTFHQLSDTKFLEKMARCKALVTTAGFESVCEAMYLGKPVFMVPVEGHYEQHCNALDATRAGAGVWSRQFNLDTLLEYLPHHESPTNAFRRWADQAEDRILAEIERAAGGD